MATAGIETDYVSTVEEMNRIGQHLVNIGMLDVAEALNTQLKRIQQQMTQLHGVTSGTVHVHSPMFKQIFMEEVETARRLKNDDQVISSFHTAEKNFNKNTLKVNTLLGTGPKSSLYYYARLTAIAAVMEENKQKLALKLEEKNEIRDIYRQEALLKERRRQIKNRSTNSTIITPLSLPVAPSRPQPRLENDDDEDDLCDAFVLKTDMSDLKRPGNEYETDSDSD